MKAANKITFKIKETGNGYGHFFAEFGEGDKKSIVEIGMVCLCEHMDMAATIISIINSYRPAEGIEEKAEIIVAESEMRRAESRFMDLQKKAKEKEKEDANRPTK